MGLPWALPRGVDCPPILLRVGALLLGEGPPRRAMALALSLVANVVRDASNLCGPLPVDAGPPAGGACMRCSCWFSPRAPSCPSCGCCPTLGVPGLSTAPAAWFSQRRPRAARRLARPSCYPSSPSFFFFSSFPFPFVGFPARGPPSPPPARAGRERRLRRLAPPVWSALTGTCFCRGRCVGARACGPCWTSPRWSPGECCWSCIAGWRT